MLLKHGTPWNQQFAEKEDAATLAHICQHLHVCFETVSIALHEYVSFVVGVGDNLTHLFLLLCKHLLIFEAQVLGELGGQEHASRLSFAFHEELASQLTVEA